MAFQCSAYIHELSDKRWRIIVPRAGRLRPTVLPNAFDSRESASAFMNATINRALLDYYATFADAPEAEDSAAIHDLALADRHFREVMDRDAVGMHEAVAELHALSKAIRDASRAGLSSETIKEKTAGAYALHSRAPFVRRLQTWPRGYPGDFETIEYLMGNRIDPPPHTGAYWIEWVALTCPMSQQHRNKLAAQAARIAEVCARRAAPRILSIGCGGCVEWPALASATRNAVVTLVDVDAGALELAKTRLSHVAGLTSHCGDVKRTVARLCAEQTFDLVVCGGLFDYLQDKPAAMAVAGLTMALEPGGVLFLTNLSDFGEYEYWLEYMADWRVLRRPEAEMRALTRLDSGRFDVAMEKDRTGLAWLVDIRRKA